MGLQWPTGKLSGACMLAGKTTYGGSIVRLPLHGRDDLLSPLWTRRLPQSCSTLKHDRTVRTSSLLAAHAGIGRAAVKSTTRLCLVNTAGDGKSIATMARLVRAHSSGKLAMIMFRRPNGHVQPALLALARQHLLPSTSSRSATAGCPRRPKSPRRSW